MLKVCTLILSDTQCNEFLKSYRLHNQEWGIEGERKYISAYDAMAYPRVDFKKVEEVITKKEGETMLQSLIY